MESLVRDGQVTRGWLGVEQRDLTAEFAESFGLPVKSGALITGVLQDGPASKAGMRPGDVVVRVAGTPVNNTSQLLTAVAALKPNQETTVTVQRGGESLELKVLAGLRPKSLQRRR
jgi:S1-C subfamily serine protease